MSATQTEQPAQVPGRTDNRDDMEAAVLAWSEHKMTSLRLLQYLTTLMGREMSAEEQMQMARWLMERNKVTHLSLQRKGFF